MGAEVARKPRERWTDAEKAQLTRRYAHEPTATVAAALGRSVGQVYGMAERLGLTKTAAYLRSSAACRLDGLRGASSRFVKGHETWNKGKPFHAGGDSVKTQFRPGQLNGRARQLAVPVGSYRINADGYLDQKISDQSGPQTLRWKAVHRLVWEAAHGGPVPDGHAVVFLPGRFSTKAEDIAADALELITRKALMARNSVQRLPKPLADLTRLRAVITRTINRRLKAEADTEEQGQPT